VDDWERTWLVAPVEELLARLPEGGQELDPAVCRRLDLGIEGLFRRIRDQYEPWPAGTTTDGSVVAFCRRTGAETIEAYGMTDVDFGGQAFPFQAEIQRTGEDDLRVTLAIGQVDQRTGEPPRFPRGTLVVPTPEPELIVGRRQVAIGWTPVLRWPLPGETPG
jgi:hypothetical protein